MAGQRPERKYYPIDLGGVWDESTTPPRVGSGLTSCQNLIYRRFGAWGKRAGSTTVYVLVAPRLPPPTPPPPPPPFNPPPPTPPVDPPTPPLPPPSPGGNIQGITLQ